MRKRSRRKVDDKKRGLFAVILAAGILFSAFFFRLRIAEAKILETSAKSWGISLLARSAGEGMRKSSPLLSAERDEDGKIALLSVDAAALQALTEQAVLSAERLARTEKLEAEVSVFDLLAGEIFSGMGPKLCFSFAPAGAVSVSARSETVSSGMNQTAYRVVLEMKMEVTAAVNFHIRTVEVCYEVVAAETLVVGDVPFGKLSGS